MKATYITFHEPVNGVYLSQVIDVVKHLKMQGITTKIIAIFSLRGFIKNRSILQNYIPDAIVLPALGKIKHWKLNGLWFKLLSSKLSNQTVICRGPLSTNLATCYLSNSKIVYDGRGAVWAEHREYQVFVGSGIEEELFEIEKKAVLNSDKQMAISSQLVDYWKKHFQYDKETFAIIPCTLKSNNISAKSKIPIPITNFLAQNKNSIIIAFSGGNSKWQQVEKVCSLAANMIKRQSNIAFIFLTSENAHISELQTQHVNNVLQRLVEPNQVTPILNKCDYGIVLRENNVTNNVASPVKIAEYLAAGLKVIISPHIGDYSKLIEDNGLGFIVNNSSLPELNKPSLDDKNICKEFANINLTKASVNYKEFLFY